jgi:hypothetical protein
VKHFFHDSLLRFFHHSGCNWFDFWSITIDGKKFKILGFLGIFSCIIGLTALGLMILAELGIIRTVA